MSTDGFSFNDPNFDSRNFNPYRPKIPKGYDFAKHQAIIADSLKKLGLPHQDNTTDIKRLLQRAKFIILQAKTLGDAIDEAVLAAGKQHDRKQLFQEISHFFLKNFDHMSKEELLMVLSWSMAEIVVAEIV